MALIGNRNGLAFELVPVNPSWEVRYGPESAAWAGLAVWAGGQNLCLHLSPGANDLDDYFFVPLGPIADWLVRSFSAIEYEERAALFPTTRNLHEDVERWGNTAPPSRIGEDEWFDSREAWWARHFLRAGSDGARLPNVALVRDDESLALAWAQPYFFGDSAPRLVYPNGQFSLAWTEGRPVLEAFVAEVAATFREAEATEVYSWAHATNPVGAASASLLEALPLFTGRSIQSLESLFRVSGPADLMNTLGLAPDSTDPAGAPQCQILRDLAPTAGPQLGDVVAEVGRRAAQKDEQAEGRWRRSRAIALDAARAATNLEEAGYLAATELRRAFGLDGQPISDAPGLLRELGLAHWHSEAESWDDRMMVALCNGGSPNTVTLTTPRTHQSWAQRFEACRALGHVLLDPIRSGAIGAASGSFSQDTRRRRSGAFAAELLMPDVALRTASDGLLDGAARPSVFQELMGRYGVGARTAAFQLWNRGWLSAPEVRDELIDNYASQM